MIVASTGAGAGAEQLSLQNPKNLNKSASKLATLIGGNHFFLTRNHFFLTPVGRFVAFTENDKTVFLFFFNFFNSAACRASAPMKHDRS